MQTVKNPPKGEASSRRITIYVFIIAATALLINSRSTYQKVFIPEYPIPIYGNCIIPKNFFIGLTAVIFYHSSSSAPDGIDQLLRIIACRRYLFCNSAKIVLNKNVLIHWQQSAIQIEQYCCNHTFPFSLLKYWKKTSNIFLSDHL